MNEEALLFGQSRSLVGVITHPPSEDNPAGRPGVVILNAGVLHHVGPNRLHVQFARALAESGFTVLRFDFSGIGDSRSRRGSQAFVEARGEEVGEALEVLAATRGIDRFLIIGICSGADSGLDVAFEDSRVAGAVLIDGFNLPSLRYAFHVYWGRFLSPQRWLRLLTGKSELWTNLRLLRRSSAASEPATQARVRTVLPSRTEYLERLQAILDRGAHLLMIYTAKSPAYFNYHGLLRGRARRWASKQRLSAVCLEESDHTFTLLSNQQRLVSLVRDWATGLPSTDPG
jgi:pimeloyl-ACP methyl ester carboxylesterase